MNFFDLLKKFPTEGKAMDFFIGIRYQSVTCPHCHSHKVYRRRSQPKLFACKNCNNSFSIFKGTIFEKSCTDIRVWFYATNLFLNAKKGISACQLQRETGVTYKTAWRILKQIRIAMGNGDIEEFTNVIIEMDETYVGGKPRNKNGENKRGRGTQKTPIVGVVNRDKKKVYCKVALPNKEGKKLTGKQLLSILEEISKNENIVITDEFRGYNILDGEKNVLHFIVNHSLGEYSNRKGVHTNNIESFWATFKRGVYGMYHRISVKYLQNYINEFCFRYNNRNLNMFELLLKQTITV